MGARTVPMTTVAIHQPQYLPWLPYCDKAAAASVFVYLDTVDFQKGGVQNRNRIQTAHGPRWLTVPVHAHRGRAIRDTALAGERWRARHRETLARAYARAPFRDRLAELDLILARPFPDLAALAIAATEWLFDQLGVTAKRVRASELAASGRKEELILSICGALGATTYLSGPGARAYQDPERFAARGIRLAYHAYRQPVYPQVNARAGFVPELSALDLVLNCGPDAARILREGRVAAA